MFFRKIGKTAVVCIGFLLDFAHLLNKIFTFEKKIAFFLLTYSDFSYLCTRIEAQMAESVDALVSNTSGATRAGSTPALGTSKSRKKLRTSNLRVFSYTQQKNQTVDFRKTSANALIVPRLWSTISVQKA